MRIRLGEIDMLDRLALAFEVGAAPAPGLIDDLVRNDEGSRAERCGYAADGRDRQHFHRAGFLQRPKIRAIVDLMRRDGVSLAVAREEDDVAAADAPECERGRCAAVWRARGFAS